MKEAIALLEKATQTLITDGHYEKCQNQQIDGSCPVCVINQAIELMQQPKAQPTEFTKKFRELIKLSEEHLSDNKIGRLQTYGKEACKIIETSEESRKELQEALKAEHDDCAFVNGAESCAICDLISNAKAKG